MQVCFSLQCHHRSDNKRRKTKFHRIRTVKSWNSEERMFKVPFDFDKIPRQSDYNPNLCYAQKCPCKRVGFFKKVPMIGQKSEPSKNTLRKRKNKKRTLYEFIYIYTHHVVKDWKLEIITQISFTQGSLGVFVLFVCYLFVFFSIYLLLWSDEHTEHFTEFKSTWKALKGGLDSGC